MAYRTPHSLRCQSPKSHNRLDHLVLVAWLSKTAKSATGQKRVCCKMGFDKADEISKRTKAMVKEKGLEKKIDLVEEIKVALSLNGDGEEY